MLVSTIVNLFISVWAVQHTAQTETSLLNNHVIIKVIDCFTSDTLSNYQIIQRKGSKILLGDTVQIKAKGYVSSSFIITKPYDVNVFSLCPIDYKIETVVIKSSINNKIKTKEYDLVLPIPNVLEFAIPLIIREVKAYENISIKVLKRDIDHLCNDIDIQLYDADSFGLPSKPLSKLVTHVLANYTDVFYLSIPIQKVGLTTNKLYYIVLRTHEEANSVRNPFLQYKERKFTSLPLYKSKQNALPILIRCIECSANNNISTFWLDLPTSFSLPYKDRRHYGAHIILN